MSLVSDQQEVGKGVTQPTVTSDRFQVSRPCVSRSDQQDKRTPLGTVRIFSRRADQFPSEGCREECWSPEDVVIINSVGLFITRAKSRSRLKDTSDAGAGRYYFLFQPLSSKFAILGSEQYYVSLVRCSDREPNRWFL